MRQQGAEFVEKLPGFRGGDKILDASVVVLKLGVDQAREPGTQCIRRHRVGVRTQPRHHPVARIGMEWRQVIGGVGLETEHRLAPFCPFAARGMGVNDLNKINYEAIAAWAGRRYAAMKGELLNFPIDGLPLWRASFGASICTSVQRIRSRQQNVVAWSAKQKIKR